MDWLKIYDRCKDLMKKYSAVLLVLAVGIFLMLLPEKNSKQIEPEQQVPKIEATQEEKLEEILAEISGVGKVKVMLTEDYGAKTIYQTDEDHSVNNDTESLQSKTVIVTQSSREETGLIQSVISPVYRGAIVVCQGGDNPAIKLSVVQAVSNVTGIRSDRITVLKMK